MGGIDHITPFNVNSTPATFSFSDRPLCLSLQVEYEYFGEKKTIDLKPGGSSVNVTEENRHDYVDLYTKFILEDSIREPFTVFIQGFLQVSFLAASHRTHRFSGQCRSSLGTLQI